MAKNAKSRWPCAPRRCAAAAGAAALALNNKNAAAPIVVVIFFIEFSLAKDKSNILSTSVRFFPFNKTALSLLFRAYIVHPRAQMKGATQNPPRLRSPTKDKSENQKGANAKFSFPGRVRTEIYSRGIFHPSESQRGRRPGWSSALIVH